VSCRGQVYEADIQWRTVGVVTYQGQCLIDCVWPAFGRVRGASGRRGGVARHSWGSLRQPGGLHMWGRMWMDVRWM
jgi:hypothetical protein